MNGILMRGSIMTAAAVLCACRMQRSGPGPQTRDPVYSLDVRLSPEARHLDVDGALTIPGDSVARDSVLISLGERVKTFTVEIIAPATSAGIADVRQLSMPTGPRVPGEGRSARWVIRPPHSVAKGEPLTFRFSLSASGDTSFLYYVGPEVAFASGWGDRWYPTVVGVGGLGTGEMTVHAPAGWRVTAGGADPTDSTREAQGIFRFRHDLPTYFTFVAGAYTVSRHPNDHGPMVSAWVLQPRPRTEQYLTGAASMIEQLSREFGPFPFGELQLVDVPRSLAQAAGFNAFSPVGMLVLNSRAFDVGDVTHMYEWLGHEMSHQWFPHAITFDPPGFQYLEEALAEYGGIRLVASLAGTDAVRRLRSSGFEYDPIYSAAAYFRLVAAGADQPLATMGNGINERNLAYNKGSLMFDMLSREVGLSRFQETLKRLTAGQKLGTITWRQFQEAVNAGAGRDMGWFFDQWLGRAGAPDFQLSWSHEGGRVIGSVSQTAPYYRAHLRIDAVGAEGQHESRTIEVTGASTAFSLSPPFAVSSVVLDPEYEVLRWTPEYRAMVDSIRKRP
jgi:hypothetical protein